MSGFTTLRTNTVKTQFWEPYEVKELDRNECGVKLINTHNGTEMFVPFAAVEQLFAAIKHLDPNGE